MSKLKKLLGAMEKSGFDAIIISSEINRRYMTGFNFSDGYVLITKNRSYILTDFRYIEAARACSTADEYEILQPTDGMIAKISELLRENGEKNVAIEDATLPCSLLERFRAAMKDISFWSGGSAVIDDLRLYKSDEEIAFMQKAQDIADDAFAHLIRAIKSDMTEVEVALELEFYMRAHGAEGIAFDTIAVSGTASSMPHGVPRNVKLERGFLTLDFGAKYNGYCSDMTRTVVIGRADEEMKRVYRTVLSAQQAALDAARVGIGCRELDSVARSIINAAGYGSCFGHSLGHGVGMYIHEAPRISPSAAESDTLKPRQVVTCEPGIYIAGKYGCRIEDMYTLLPDGTLYNFATSSKELIELG